MSEFRPTVETTARWGARQRAILVWSAPGLVLLAAAVVLRRELLAVVMLLSAFAVLVGLRLYVAVSRRRVAPGRTGALWTGPASLRVDDLRLRGVADGVQVKNERRLRRWTRGVNAVNARMEVRPDEIRWTLGRYARLLGATGAVRIAWSDIARVEVGRVPGTLPGFGGGITIHLTNGHHLDAQFLGSRADLEAALAVARIDDS